MNNNSKIISQNIDGCFKNYILTSSKTTDHDPSSGLIAWLVAAKYEQNHK